MPTFGATTYDEAGIRGFTASGAAYGGRAQLTESGSVSKLTAHLHTGFGGGGNFIGYILSDNAGSPGSTVHGTTQARSITAANVWADYDFTFSTSVSLSAGYYWLVIQADNNDGWACYATAGSQTMYVAAGTYQTCPTGGAWASSAALDMAVYATYSPPVPTVTDVSPATGTYAGGTSVTITGTNFTDATDVDFGTTAASSFTVNSATSISATTPAHAVGTVDVTVTTAAGTSATTGTDNDFEFIVPAPTISAAQSGSDIVVTWS